MRVGMLGPLEVRGASGGLCPLGGPRQRAVLVALALRVGRTVPIDRLIADVWGEDLPSDPSRTLATVISRVRASLEDPEVLEREGVGYRSAGYRLLLPADVVDAHRFEQLVARGRARRHEGDHEAAREALCDALALWRGEPLTELGDVPLCGWARPRLHEQRLQALEARLEIDLAANLAEQVTGELFDLVAEHPLRERFVAQLMRALAATGRRSEALTAYEATREHLAEELGIDPSPELAQLHLDLLRDDGTPGSPSPHRPVHDPTARGSARHAVPLPLLAPATVPYVGRAELLERLRATWAAVSGDASARAVLLVGEPGVGKTRTAAEIAAEVFSKGAVVLAGRCDEELSAPYQPFIEALDWQSAHDPGLPLGRLSGELVRLLPDLDGRRSDLPRVVASEPEVEEHRLFQAVTSWLGEVSREHGLLLVIDDLQWASLQTLRLLSHVLRGAATDSRAHVLLLATYRDTDVAVDHPLVTSLGRLRRSGPVEEFALEGLSADEVHALIEDAAGHPLEGDAAVALVHTVHAETEGNPFFVVEVLHHLVETGAVVSEDGRWRITLEGPVDVPTGVRDVVAQRLSRLTRATVEVLRLAAVIGRDADVELLTVLVDGGTEVALDALEEALDARLVEETGHQLRFTHALVRAALLDTLSASRRCRIHGLIADALERFRSHDAAAVAHHAVSALPVDGRRERAIRWAIAAGEQALDQRAADVAHHWFTTALEVIDEADDRDERSWLTARCGLGHALRDLQDHACGAVLLDAGRRALASGEVELALRAATTNTRLGDVTGVDAPERVAFLEDLLARLGDAPAEQRGPVLAILSLELTFVPGDGERQLALVDEAVELARASGDPRLEAWILHATTTSVMVPRRARQLPARTTRVVELAELLDDPAASCLAYYQHVASFLGVGDISTARAQSDRARALAGPDVPATLHWMTRVQHVQFLAYDGDPATAREENAACLQLGQELDEPDATTFWGGIEAMLAVIDGTLPTLADAFGTFADANPARTGWRAGQVWALALAGRQDEARVALELHGLLDPTVVPEDWLQLTAFAALAGAAYELDLPDLADALLPLVEPYRDLWANVVVFSLFPSETTVGLAHAAAHRWDEAVEAMRRAHELMASRTRSHVPYAAWQLGRLLLARGQPEDLREARDVVDTGLAASRSMGMGAMTANLQRLASRPI